MEKYVYEGDLVGTLPTLVLFSVLGLILLGCMGPASDVKFECKKAETYTLGSVYGFHAEGVFTNKGLSPARGCGRVILTNKNSREVIGDTKYCSDVLEPETTQTVDISIPVAIGQKVDYVCKQTEE